MIKLKVVGGPNAGQVVEVEQDFPKVRLLTPESLYFNFDYSNPLQSSVVQESTVYRRMRLQANDYKTEILIPDSWTDAMALVQLIRGYSPDK